MNQSKNPVTIIRHNDRGLAPDCDQHHTSTVRRHSQLNVKSSVLCVLHTSVVAANCVSSQ